MSGNRELDRLKSDAQAAFDRKQEAYKWYKEARELTDAAYEDQERAWKKMNSARDTMNSCYEELQKDNEIWDNYGQIRDNNNPQIEQLKKQADDLYHNMSDSFSSATESYDYGDKAAAKSYSDQGKYYQAQLEALNTQIRQLGQEVKNARTYAETHTSKKASSRFRQAREYYEETKKIHQKAKRNFQSAKKKHKRLYLEFEALEREYKSKEEAFQAALQKVKEKQGARQRDDETLMERAGVPYNYRNACKVVKESDGTTNFYFGGLMQKDGLWHGHIAMDSSGKITYRRMPQEKHGKQNFTTKKDGWTDLYGGSIGDQPVLVKFGTGKNEGHTLIADNMGQSKRSFNRRYKDGHRNHNHYGPKREGPGYVEEDRGKYTGPGH